TLIAASAPCSPASSRAEDPLEHARQYLLRRARAEDLLEHRLVVATRRARARRARPRTRSRRAPRLLHEPVVLGLRGLALFLLLLLDRRLLLGELGVGVSLRLGVLSGLRRGGGRVHPRGEQFVRRLPVDRLAVLRLQRR